MSEENSHYLLANLHTFKTQQCKDQQHHMIFSPYYYNCPYYHSRADYRRNPFIDEKQQELVYSEQYISDDFDQNGCMNWVQYIYHPKIYKTTNCQNQHCQRVYCPKRHNYQINQYLYKKQNNQNTKSQQKCSFLQELNTKINQYQYLRNMTLDKLKKTKSQALIELFEKETRIINNLEMKLINVDQEQKKKQANLKIHIQSLTSPVQSLARIKSVDRQYKQFNKGQRLDILEDRHHQFKMFKGKQAKNIAYMVLQYICAFLNSEGGTIYLGVDDDSIVRGLDTNQRWIDQLLLAIDNDGKMMLSPPLIPQKYKLRVIPVRNHTKLWLNVIEIKVFPQSQNQKKILTLFNRQCYLRMNASNHRLSASDIMEYMRLNNNGKISETLQNFSQNIDTMNLQQLKQMQQKIIKINGKISQSIRKKQREQNSKN